MHTKSLQKTLSHSQENSSRPKYQKSAERVVEASPCAHEQDKQTSVRLVTRLTAHRSAVRDRQAGLISLLDGPAMMAPPSSLAFVDKLLVEAARLAADVLELAENADDGLRKSRQGDPSKRAMRVLADTSFDVILQLDAARHELGAPLEVDVSHQRRRSQDALRAARGALGELEQQLTRALAN